MWGSQLKLTKSSTENHLHQLDYVNHFDISVPQKLSEKKTTNKQTKKGIILTSTTQNYTSSVSKISQQKRHNLPLG